MKINMRTTHRYLGFFLAGIMSIYALSGVVLIYKDTDIFKVTKKVEKKLKPGINLIQLAKRLKIEDFKISKTEGDILYFDSGSFNKKTGLAKYSAKEFPYVLKKLTKLHKSDTEQPLYWLNVFFGLSLLFFVISSFWMFRPKTKIFRNGIVVSMIGIVLTLVLLFL